MGFFLNKIKIIFWTLFYYSLGRSIFNELGSGCRFSGWINVPQKGGFLSLGANIFICHSAEFTVTKGAKLIIGDNVFLGPSLIISAHKEVSIGKNTLIAENVSIHDNNHVCKETNLPINSQGFIAEACKIDEDCWVGAGAKILKGARMHKHSILGAGSVLTKVLSEYDIAVGVPARVIKNRIGNSI